MRKEEGGRKGSTIQSRGLLGADLTEEKREKSRRQRRETNERKDIKRDTQRARFAANDYLLPITLDLVDLVYRGLQGHRDLIPI